MAAVLYGDTHPYGHPEIGTEASTKAMTRDDMEKFWKQNFVPNNAALVVSGQITRDELRPLVEKAFGKWEKGTPAAQTTGEPSTSTARLVLVDKPGAPQTQLRVASIGAPRSTPDYAALQVLEQETGILVTHRDADRRRGDAGLPQTFQILDSADQLSLIKRLIKAMNIDDDKYPPKELQYFINANKEEFDELAWLDPMDLVTKAPLLRYPAWAAPVLSHGLLYVRGRDKLVCLELIPGKK